LCASPEQVLRSS